MPFGDNQPTVVHPYRVEALSILMYENGKQTFEIKNIKERRAECMQEFRDFGGVEMLLDESNPEEYRVMLSEKCNQLLNDTLAKFVHDGTK